MTEVRITKQEAADCMERLWHEGLKKDPFSILCTILRVSGLQDADWDPLQESEEAFEDFNWYLKVESEDLSDKAQWRIGLLMYCQAVEMSEVHSMLANLLRILLDQPYHMNPLGSLGRANKKRMFEWYPPSAKVKWRKLHDMAQDAGQAELVRMIDVVYDDAVRNAFSHSDYIITDTHLRWTESGLVGSMQLEQVNNLISNSFDFFGAFMGIRDRWLKLLAKAPRYHKWPNYEVLELLKNDEGELHGFRIHFSNGNGAHFTRTAKGVDIVNMLIRGDGSLELMIGSLDELEPVWKVEGHSIEFGNRDALDDF